MHVDVGLDTAPFNTELPPSQDDMNAVYEFIRNTKCSTNTGDKPNLTGALAMAFHQFDDIGESDANGRDKKIVIVSNSYLTDETDLDEICKDHEAKIRTGMDYPNRKQKRTYGITGINVVMINLGGEVELTDSGETVSWPSVHADDSTDGSTSMVSFYDTYIECLVGYDLERIFVESEVNFSPELESLVMPVREEVCSAPTNAPTSDPTYFPTFIPSEQPTIYPTDQPSEQPTIYPTNWPTEMPTSYPSTNPTVIPTNYPSEQPTSMPSTEPLS